MKVVIRTAEQLDKMGETGEAVKILAKNDKFKGKSYPLVYQFAKGMAGESIRHTPDDVIGSVSNVRITEEGLTGDVEIIFPNRNAKNFDGKTIDNLVVAKRPDLPKNAMYDLRHLVVYNAEAKQFVKRQETAGKNVEKLYNAPKEMIDIDPNDGEVLSRTISTWEKEKDDMMKEYSLHSNGTIHHNILGVDGKEKEGAHE